MGLVLIPNEIIEAVKQLELDMDNFCSNYERVFREVHSFAQNKKLKSEAWNTAKERLLEDHQYIMQGFEAIKISIKNELDILKNSVTGMEDLYEDELCMQIEQLTNEYRQYEFIITLYRGIMPTIQLFHSGMESEIKEQIEQQEILLKQTEEEIALLNAKLDLLYEKSEETSKLFIDILAVINAVNNGIADAELCIIEKEGEIEGNWKVVISEAIQKCRQENIIKGISDRGYTFLVSLELGTDNWKNADYVETDKEGNITKIRNHDVGDGGITVGMGIFVRETDADRIKMLEELGIQWNDTTQWVSYDTLVQAYNNISIEYVHRVNYVIEKNNYYITQEQYDALFAMAYNRPALFSDGGAIDYLLAIGSHNMDEWRDKIIKEYQTLDGWEKFGKGWTNRLEDELELFFRGDYVRTH